MDIETAQTEEMCCFYNERFTLFCCVHNVGLLQNSTEYVSAHNQIALGGPIEGSFIKRFVKKVIRKLIRFYVVPIMTEQNALNYHYSNAIMQLNGYVNKNSANDPAEMAVKIEELELRQMNSKREIAELTEQLEALKKEISRMKAGE